MKVCHYQEVEAQVAEETEGVTVRWVIGEADGAPHFAMRIFDVQPGHGSPLHSHWWEHEVFVLAGTGMVTIAGQRSPIKEGTVVFVPGEVEHQFVNTGHEVLRFICLIPHPWLEGVARKYRPA